MTFFKHKHWTEKLSVDASLRAQAKARYERHIANGLNKADAERRVRAWVNNQVAFLASKQNQDPWLGMP